MTRDVPFSCVPVGTRNHFAMDLDLDRKHPLRALDAAVDGEEKSIDVGLVAGRVFLNNVSFGLYAEAIADPDYRSHRARSLADAALDNAKFESEITVTLPDGRVVEDIEVLLASNNPYRFIGPPDFAARPALDTGALGIVLGDRHTRLKPGPTAFTRWEAQTLTLHSESPEIRAGVDGELRVFRAPVEIGIAPQALRVLVPRQSAPRNLESTIKQINEQALIHLSGLPALPERSDLEAKSPMLQRLHNIDAALFARIAGWETPALDRAMPALSDAASHSKIWIAVAMVMSLFGGKRGRRTAMESLAAVGITSFLANLGAKSLFRRQRPTEEVPEERRLPLPTSSSMPSGHAASGAAFSRVVGAAYPWLRAPLTALAATVGFSRVYTGVHYPADVLVGWLLGRGIGSLVLDLLSIARRVPRAALRAGKAEEP